MNKELRGISMINFIRKKFIHIIQNERITQEILDSIDKRFAIFLNCEFVENVDFRSFCAVGLDSCDAKDVILPTETYSFLEKAMCLFKILPSGSLMRDCSIGNLSASTGVTKYLYETTPDEKKHQNTIH